MTADLLTGWALHAQLPPTVPPELVREIIPPDGDVSTHRRTSVGGWDFDVPPGVFAPSPTSALLHTRLLDGTLPVAGRRVVAMGAGLGVEAVVAGVRGAAEVWALDVHPGSVRAAEAAYRRIVGPAGPPLHALVSDVWDGFPDGERVDVVTFNPPAVELALAGADADVVRGTYVGRTIVERFVDGLVARDLLAPGGVVYLVLSNTAALRELVARVLGAGFDVRAVHVEDWGRDDVRTFLFALTR